MLDDSYGTHIDNNNDNDVNYDEIIIKVKWYGMVPVRHKIVKYILGGEAHSVAWYSMVQNSLVNFSLYSKHF